jgi:hypothetical protein
LKAALEKSENERKAKAAIDNGISAYNRGDYAGSKEQLQQIPESSMYYQRAAKKLLDPHYRAQIAMKQGKEPKEPKEKPERTAEKKPPKEDPSAPGGVFTKVRGLLAELAGIQ